MAATEHFTAAQFDYLMNPVEISAIEQNADQEDLQENAQASAGVGASSSHAYGDFNGDGKDDLAVGVPGEAVGSILNAGAVNVLYGSASRLQTASPTDQFWHQNSPDVNDAAETSDVFGSSLVVGDFNGDGKDDLAIGVPGEGVSGQASAGAVNVLYGSAAGLQATTPADQFLHQDTSGVEDFAFDNDQFGFSLAAGDFNGDNEYDLAVGVPFDDVGSFNVGAVNVLYGSGNRLQTSSPADQFWHQDSLGVEDAIETGDKFASSLA